MREVNAILGKDIFLGRCGENKATCVSFNISEWKKTYGDGTPYVLHQRNGDKQPYPCDIEVNGSTVSWCITNSDLVVAGRGRVELQYYKDDTLVKSETFTTVTERALGPASEKAPEPYESWMETMLHTATEAQESAEAAADSAGEAAASAQTARAAELSANSAAQTATNSATNAKASEANAQKAADEARASETNAQLAAKEADESKADAAASAASANAAVGKTSYIGNNGNWFEWDAKTNAFVDTGVAAQGPKGEAGENGVATPTGGFFTLHVDENGDLWSYSEGGGTPQFEFDVETGALYVVQEV